LKERRIESFQLIESRRSSFICQVDILPAIDRNSLVRKKKERRRRRRRKGRGQIVTMKRLAGPPRQQFNTVVFQSGTHSSVLLLIVALKGDERSPRGLKNRGAKQNSGKRGIALESKDGTESISPCCIRAHDLTTGPAERRPGQRVRDIFSGRILLDGRRKVPSLWSMLIELGESAAFLIFARASAV